MPLLWINITVAGNRWEISGLNIGQIIYWVIIGLAFYVSWKTPYKRYVLFLFVLTIGLRILESFIGGEVLYILRLSVLSIIFIIAGAHIYGNNPKLLHRQLIIFLALSIPIMILQILGTSSFFMGWDADYAHNITILNVDEVGTFKEIAVYPTFMVGLDALHYQIGQGRPVGLLYANNVLSIFVSISVVLNLIFSKASRINLSDIVVTVSAVLVMSKTVFIILIVFYSSSFLFKLPSKRIVAAKLIGLFLIFIILYYFLFPGLFLANFSEEMLKTSFFLRFFDLMTVIGINDIGIIFHDNLVYLGGLYNKEESYSQIGVFLRNKYFLLVLFPLFIFSLIYLNNVKKSGEFFSCEVHIVVLIVCVLTQFAIPFAIAPSFQFIFGLALYPLFKKMWDPMFYSNRLNCIRTNNSYIERI